MRPILVIEDDYSIRETLRILLERRGHRVVTAENGAEAIEVLKRIECPCLIILNIKMPVMDGHQFLEALEKMPEFEAVPVVLETASKVMPRSKHVVGAISKPFGIDAIFSYIDR